MSKEKDSKVRVNCYIKSEIKDYMDSQCEFYGMSQGAFLSLVLMQHKQSSELSSSVVELSKVLEDIKILESSKKQID